MSAEVKLSSGENRDHGSGRRVVGSDEKDETASMTLMKTHAHKSIRGVQE